MSVRRIGPREAQSLVEREGYRYVDVRSIPEFESGHPAGAYNVPIAHASSGGMQPNPDFLAVMEKHFAKTDKLVIGCLAGGRSIRAAEMLVSAGYTDVVDQRAGWGGIRDPFGAVTEAGWQREGLPSATSAEPGRSFAELSAEAKG